MSLPRAALPARIISDKPGTWAHDTMARRVREEILARVFTENPLDEERFKSIGTRQKLEALDREMQSPATSLLTPIEEDGGPDVQLWNESFLKEALQRGDTWLSAPWLITEFYFYRRVLAAFRYFETKHDPFELQKRLGLKTALPAIAQLVAKTLASCSDGSADAVDVRTGLRLHVFASLWGNKMDLSLWPAEHKADEKSNGGGQEHSQQATEEALSHSHEAEALLADDFDRLWGAVSGLLTAEGKARARQADIVTDNAGLEVFCDLCLADYLVSRGLVDTVVLRLKANPTFVSDAMAKDVMHTIAFLLEAPQEACRALGQRWQGYVDSGKWQLKEHLFWAQPLAFWEMPSELRQELQQSSQLVVVKGDCNYRRILGDRWWDSATPFVDVASYFPTRLLALRALKADFGCGMPRDKTERAAASDPKWMVNGNWAVVQFFDPSESH